MKNSIATISVAASVTLAALAGEETSAPPAAVAAPADEAAITQAPPPAASTNEPTVVTADRSQLDYSNRVWIFEGNVLVVDPRITIRADKMRVFFGGDGTNQSGSIQKAIAEGAVVINQDNKKSHSDRAEYTSAEGKVVLTGNPQVQSPDGVVICKRITFWRGQDKMDVESDATDTNRTRLIIYPEEQRKKTDEDVKSKEPSP